MDRAWNLNVIISVVVCARFNIYYSTDAAFYTRTRENIIGDLVREKNTTKNSSTAAVTKT